MGRYPSSLMWWYIVYLAYSLNVVDIVNEVVGDSNG